MASEPELKAKISLDGSSWEAGMKGVSSSLKKLGGEFADIKNLIAGAFTISALTSQTKAIVDYGSKIHDLSTRFGISTDALQEFDYAAKLSGSSLDSFVMAFRKLTVNQVDAVRNGGDMLQFFTDLGVSISDLKTKNPEEIFRQIAEKVRTAGNNSNVLTAVVKTMGKSADEIIPAMRDGMAGMARELDAIGGKLGPDAIKRLDDYGDAWVRMMTKMKPLQTWLADQAGMALAGAQILAKRVQIMFAPAQTTEEKDAIGIMWMELHKMVEEAMGTKNTKGDPLKTAVGLEEDVGASRRSGKLSSPRTLSTELQANALQKIGAFVGGPDRLVNIAERQLGTLMRIEKNTQQQGGSGGVVFPT